MSKTSWTLKELLDAEFEPDPEAEEAFRRGYFYGVQDALEAFKAGVTPAQLTDYYKGALWSWRFAEKFDKLTEPPPMPKPKKRV